MTAVSPATIDLPGGHVEYREIPGAADRPPLVFLHEGLGSMALWRGFPDDVAAATGRRALLFSRHGYGGSAALGGPRTPAYMHVEGEGVLPQVLRTLGYDDPVLIGHSDGASIALINAGSGAGTPSGMVLLAPHVIVEDVTVRGIDDTRKTYLTSDMGRRMARYHTDADATFWGWNDIWLSPAFRGWDIRDLLPGVVCPVLAVQGLQDQYATMQQLDLIEEGVSGTFARRELDDCRHAPHLDQPEATVQTVTTFIAGLDPAGSCRPRGMGSVVPMENEKHVDLVLGGGGVRGIAHVGALSTLSRHGYVVQRVAGASSGAIAGALIAAGATSEEMKRVLVELDWRAFTISDIVARMADAPLIGGLVDRFRQDRTIDPMEWIGGLLADRGVNTWADLRLEDPEDWVPEDQRYKLVVRCLDVVNRRVVRLPWDYHRYGLDPDEQSVAQAVRASMSVPLVFDPVRIGDRENGGGLLIDGGLGAGFGVDVLDRRDGGTSTHPTFALQLMQRPLVQEWPTSDLGLMRSVMETMLETGNAMVPVGPRNEARTVRLDTSHIRTLDVGITAEEEQELFDIGARTMEAFLSAHDGEDGLS